VTMVGYIKLVQFSCNVTVSAYNATPMYMSKHNKLVMFCLYFI